METINICGVGCRKEALETLSYETLMNAALKTPEFFQKPNARETIHKELLKNGFKPTVKNTGKTKDDKHTTSPKHAERGTRKESKPDSKKSS